MQLLCGVCFCAAIVNIKWSSLGQAGSRKADKKRPVGSVRSTCLCSSVLPYCGAVRPALPGHSRLHFEAKHQTMSAYLCPRPQSFCLVAHCQSCRRVGHQEVKRLLAGQINLYRIYRRPPKALNRDYYLLDWRGITGE